MPSPTKAQKKWVAGELQSPINGPGHTPMKLGKIEAESNLFKRPTYNGAELRPYEGRPGANDAFDMPSIVNGQEVPRKRPSLICVGVRDNGPISAGSPRRFA